MGLEGIPEMLTSGQQVFVDNEIVNPGDKVIAKITIFSHEYMEGKLYQNQQFIFCEGSVEIGTVKIVEIVNKKLEKNKLDK